MLARPAGRDHRARRLRGGGGPDLLARCRQRVEPCGDERATPTTSGRGVETLLTEELESTDVRGPGPRRGDARRPAASPAAQRGGDNQSDRIKEQVEKALGDIRPALQADGGDIELVDVTDDGVVQVRLQGACAGCPMSQLTLTNGVERHLKNVVPGVERVENVGF